MPCKFLALFPPPPPLFVLPTTTINLPVCHTSRPSEA